MPQLSVNRVPITWTSDASGNATVTTPTLNGRILCVEFAPGTGGSQPSNNYSATLTAVSGFDLLLGKASANLSNTAVSRLIPAQATSDTNTLGVVSVAEACTLNISGAGNAKSGTVNVYLG
jgi:hypothetical protein